MPKSICVILPVHNAAADLERHTVSLVELLAGLVSHFEIVIVDDGSTDDTGETGIRLSQNYPQVSFARHAKQLGIEAAVKTGMQNSSGIIVFVSDKPMDEKLADESSTAIRTLRQQNEIITEDQIINHLINLGLTLKEYRVQPPKTADQLVRNAGHPAVPKNHFARFFAQDFVRCFGRRRGIGILPVVMWDRNPACHHVG